MANLAYLELHYYTADWCAPCKQTLPVVKTFCSQKNFPLEVFDIEKYPSTIKSLGVSSVPTMILYADGKEVKRRTGSINSADLEKWLK